MSDGPDADSAVQVSLRLRILHHSMIAFGPGKADLLQAIISTGSISQAARQMDMSYRRAWQLVTTMNQCFISPLVETQTGGSHGGGALVTPLGHEVLQLFRQMEQVALAASMPLCQQISGYLNLP